MISKKRETRAEGGGSGNGCARRYGDGISFVRVIGY